MRWLRRPKLLREQTETTRAERRQLTVLLRHLAGSTELPARLVPGHMGLVIFAYQGATTEVIRRWGGHGAKYMDERRKRDRP
jgi:class 3 adenylate cyclase